MNTYNKSDIEKIVKDEIKIFIKNGLDSEVSKLLKASSGSSRKETIEIAKEALSKFAEFMYIRKSIWKADIK
jgi:hypothetical protein